jgi:hypothetical protein
MKNAALCLLLLLSSAALNAQNVVNSVAKATEFTIPVSPAFDLLAVSPSQITRPSNIREFKVDWSFRSWRLKPNIAIQAQPIWELAYNRPDLTRYRKAPKWLKTLSTLDVSAGTIEDADQTRRASMALKINLFRQRDPLNDMRLFVGIDSNFRKRQDALTFQIHALKEQRRATASAEKLAVTLAIDSLLQLRDVEARAQKARIQEVAQTYVQAHWNAAHLDVAWGKVFSFDNPALDSLRLRGQASAVWANGSVGLNRKVLLTGMVKYLMQEALDSLSKGGNVLSGGVGFRYGNPKFSFFSELVFSRFDTPPSLEPATLNLTQVEQYSISYGGDWRINYNILLSYGVRLDYSTGFRFKNIVPIAGVSCMMR